jgi:hypothetical protein
MLIKFHRPVEYMLTLDEFDTSFVLLVIRISANANANATDTTHMNIVNHL